MCSEFGGCTFDECMSMPARRFFTMLEAARECRYERLVDLADIAAIPNYKKEYHEKLVENFNRHLPEHAKAIERKWAELDARPKLEGQDALNAMRAVFAGKK